jgi:S-disulfanyl-L-cysteine oxidoreductase SoxD
MGVYTMRCIVNLLLLGVLLDGAASALAQEPVYRLGRTPSQEEIRAWDISIGPEGKELPPGRGTANQGTKIFEQKCAECHGQTGVEGPAARLSGPHTISLIVPLATTIWDYINRAMPRDKEGTLTGDEVYALTALLLKWNGIIQESTVLDAKSLPKIQMPNRNGFFPPKPEWNRLPQLPFGIYPR